MTHASLFSGIGGFDLAAEWAGWENIFHCEWNPFGQKVLAHHFPNSKSYNDITKTDFSIHAGEIDVLTGGFPCQPYSSAGKQLGTADERHLWPEMLRTIKEVKPTWVVGENVLGIVNWGGGMVFNDVQVDLENQGYEVQAFILPACGKNAPHKRQRVFFVAYSNSKRYTRPTSTRIKENERRANNNEHRECSRKDKVNNWNNWPKQPYVLLRDDGLPTGLDYKTFPSIRRESIKAAGNAIVPQVAFEIFKAINQFESLPS
jgi:DNA (cytosine-5)-methyltransferase 1